MDGLALFICPPTLKISQDSSDGNGSRIHTHQPSIPRSGGLLFLLLLSSRRIVVYNMVSRRTLLFRVILLLALCRARKSADDFVCELCGCSYCTVGEFPVGNPFGDLQTLPEESLTPELKEALDSFGSAFSCALMDAVFMDTVFITNAEERCLELESIRLIPELRDLCGCPALPPKPPSKPQCFSGFNTVQVEGKGVIRMANLQVGDFVLTKTGRYSRVYSMAHKDKHTEIDFYQVSFEGTDSSVLEVSADHLVFVDKGDGEYVGFPAHQLRPGHVVQDQQSTRLVSNIGTIKRTGLYSPLTEDGHLFVSNVLVSSYIKVFDSSSLLLDDHTFVHGLLAPLRIWSLFASPDADHDETYTSDGISHRVWPLLRVAWWMKEWQHKNRWLLHMFTSVVCLPLVAIFWVAEHVSLLLSSRYGS